jgi:hypothetical protein
MSCVPIRERHNPSRMNTCKNVSKTKDFKSLCALSLSQNPGGYLMPPDSPKS